ncbi:MAG: DUF6352 family protein [Alphaproteobacteria bacterium]|nr:DUF6352 family protein [Alphaproteobacteria bacterium]
MNEFWVASGHLLLDRDEAGRLVLSDDFLKAFLARPELMPPEEACDAERELHADLLEAPRRSVPQDALAALADADARENWVVFLAIRTVLMGSPTLEGAYLRLARVGLGRVPPLVFNQLTHVILRNALHGCTDAMAIRAAELFFRPQRVSTHEGRVLLADADAVSVHERAREASPLLAMLGGPATSALDVLTETNAPLYWGRSDAHDMVLDLGAGRAGLATAMRLWLRHMLGIEAAIEPVSRIEDPDWRWFVGLDSTATRIGNALWRGEAAEADNLLALFRCTLAEDVPVLEAAMGHPVYLLLSAGEEGTLRVKPHNLLVGLPLAVAG